MALYADMLRTSLQELAPGVMGTDVNVDIYQEGNSSHFLDTINLGIDMNRWGIPSSLTVLFLFSPAQYDPQAKTLNIPIQLKGLFEGLRQPTSSPYMQVSSQDFYDLLQTLSQFRQSSQSQVSPFPSARSETSIQPSSGNNQGQIPLGSFEDSSSPDFQDSNSFIPRSTNDLVWHGMDAPTAFRKFGISSSSILKVRHPHLI